MMIFLWELWSYIQLNTMIERIRWTDRHTLPLLGCTCNVPNKSRQSIKHFRFMCWVCGGQCWGQVELRLPTPKNYGDNLNSLSYVCSSTSPPLPPPPLKLIQIFYLLPDMTASSSSSHSLSKWFPRLHILLPERCHYNDCFTCITVNTVTDDPELPASHHTPEKPMIIYRMVI